MNNINLGDRLLCKKTFYDMSYPYFCANEYCNIYFIQKDDPVDYYYYISDKDFKKYAFSFSDKKLFEYFYTNQEIREIKLNKIYEEAKY